MQSLEDSVEVCRGARQGQVLCVAPGSRQTLPSSFWSFTSEKLLGCGLFRFKCQLFILWTRHCASQSLPCWAKFVSIWILGTPVPPAHFYLKDILMLALSCFYFTVLPPPQGSCRKWRFGNMNFSFLTLPRILWYLREAVEAFYLWVPLSTWTYKSPGVSGLGLCCSCSWEPHENISTALLLLKKM